LPADLPEKIEVDISGLKAIDDVVLLETVKVSEEIKILTDGKEVLAKIEPPAKEEVVVAPVTEETTVEGTEGEKAGEEIKQMEEKKPEEAKIE